MVSVTYQQRNQERLAQAIESCKLYEEFGFATVASTSEPNKFYFVDFNENYYATACSCQGNSEFGADCLHCLALDRVGDSLRPDFYTMHGIQRPAKQQVSTPAATTEYRVSRVDGIVTKWYPEYRQGAEWFRFPQPDGGQAVSFVVKGRAEQWVAERIASIEESKAERKMDAFKRKMDEQYASDPRTELAKQRTAQETAESNMRHFYDEY